MTKMLNESLQKFKLNEEKRGKAIVNSRGSACPQASIVKSKKNQNSFFKKKPIPLESLDEVIDFAAVDLKIIEQPAALDTGLRFLGKENRYKCLGEIIRKFLINGQENEQIVIKKLQDILADACMSPSPYIKAIANNWTLISDYNGSIEKDPHGHAIIIAALAGNNKAFTQIWAQQSTNFRNDKQLCGKLYLALLYGGNQEIRKMVKACLNNDCENRPAAPLSLDTKVNCSARATAYFA